MLYLMLPFFGLLAVAAVIAAPLWSSTLTVCTSAPACAYSDFQAALNAAEPGDVIELRAGDFFNTQTGFILPVKQGADYITIRSSRWNELPPDGYRIQPIQADLMPKLRAVTVGTPVIRTAPIELPYSIDPVTDRVKANGFANGTPVAFNRPVPGGLEPSTIYYVIDRAGDSFKLARNPDDVAVDITAVPGSTSATVMKVEAAHHYKFDGIEVLPAKGIYTYYLVIIGNPNASVFEQVPYDIQLNHMYIHGNQGEDGPRHCVFVGAKDFSLINSHVAECKDINSDSSGILAGNGLWSYYIENNYLESATLGVLFGGFYTNLTGTQISNVTFRRNYLRKKKEWRWWMRPVLTNPGLVRFIERSGSACSPQKPCYLFTATPEERRVEWMTDQALTLPVGTGRALVYLSPDGVLKARYGPASNVSITCSDGVSCESSEQSPVWPADVMRLAVVMIRDNAFTSVTRQTFIHKGTFEVKQGRNMLLEGNVFEDQWTPDVGTYCAFMLTPRTERGSVPQAVAENLEIRNNIVRNVNCAISVTGTDDQPLGVGFGGNIRFYNNLFQNVSYISQGTNATLQGLFMRGLHRFKNVEISHNTIFNIDGPLLAMLDNAGAPPSELRMLDNLVIPRERNPGEAARPFPAIIGNSATGWTAVRDRYLQNSMLKGNVLLNRNNFGTASTLRAQYPTDENYLLLPGSSVEAIGLLQPNTSDLRLCKGTVSHCPAASDFSARAAQVKSTTGRDIGADIEELRALTSGVVEGIPNFAARAGVTTVMNGLNATLSYTAPDDNACELQVYEDSNYSRLIADIDPDRFELAQFDLRPGNLNEGLRRQFVIGANNALEADKDYYYKLVCGSEIATGTFSTKTPVQ